MKSNWLQAWLFLSRKKIIDDPLLGIQEAELIILVTDANLGTMYVYLWMKERGRMADETKS